MWWDREPAFSQPHLTPSSVSHSPTPQAEGGMCSVPLLGRTQNSWGLKAQPFPQFPLGMSQTPRPGTAEKTTPPSGWLSSKR